MREDCFENRFWFVWNLGGKFGCGSPSDRQMAAATAPRVERPPSHPACIELDGSARSAELLIIFRLKPELRISALVQHFAEISRANFDAIGLDGSVSFYPDRKRITWAWIHLRNSLGEWKFSQAPRKWPIRLRRFAASPDSKSETNYWNRSRRNSSRNAADYRFI